MAELINTQPYEVLRWTPVLTLACKSPRCRERNTISPVLVGQTGATSVCSFCGTGYTTTLEVHPIDPTWFRLNVAMLIPQEESGGKSADHRN